MITLLKKGVYLLLVMTFMIFSACSENNYYQEGYDVGFDAGFDEGFSKGYLEGKTDSRDSGYRDSYDEPEIGLARYAQELEWDAVHFVTDAGGWHPEEAWMLIEAYQNNEPFYSDGSVPSDQDYLDAIESLIQFYDYFYSHRYEDD